MTTADLSLIRRQLRRRLSDRVADDADPAALSLALLAALQGGLLMTQTRRDTVALETVMDTVVSSVRRYSTR